MIFSGINFGILYYNVPGKEKCTILHIKATRGSLSPGIYTQMALPLTYRFYHFQDQPSKDTLKNY